MDHNLATAIYEKTGKGVVIDGGLRDLSGILEIEGFRGFVRAFKCDFSSPCRHDSPASANAKVPAMGHEVLRCDVIHIGQTVRSKLTRSRPN